MIVVDTTVLADLLFNDGPRRAAAVNLFEADPQWICTGLALYELGNVAWKQVQFGGMSLAVAQPALAQLEEVLTKIEQRIPLDDVLPIGVERGLTFYDASHVWLAQSRGLKLQTRDRKILQACPEVACAMPT